MKRTFLDPPISLTMPGPRAILPIWVVLALIAWCALAPVVGNGFVNMDDPINFLQNHDYRGLGWKQLKLAFTTERLGVYQPLGSLLLSAQYMVCGMDARGYHAVSLLIHALNAIVLHGLTLMVLARVLPESGWTNGDRRALLAALPVALYAAHPQRAEPVAWATAQLYLPCALFCMLAVAAYLQANPRDRPERIGWLWGVYGLSMTAMLFMPGAVCLPFVLLVLDVYPLERFGPGRWFGPGARRAVLQKIPIVIPSLILMGIAYWSKRHNQTLTNLAAREGIGTRVAQAGTSLWLYVTKLVVPIGVAPFYPRPEHGDFRWPEYVAQIAAMIVLTMLVLRSRRRLPWLAASWLIYIVILGPHLGLVRVGNTLAADRYCYIASTVWVVVAAAGLCWFNQVSGHLRALPMILVVGLMLVPVLMTSSRAQARLWGDSIRMWTYVKDRAPWSSQLHANLGTALGEAGRFGEALKEYDQALRIAPEFAEALLNQGSALAGLGNYDDAIVSYSKVLALDPEHRTAALNLGSSLAAVGRLDEAVARFEALLRLEPRFAEAHVSLGTTLVQQQKTDEAAAHFLEATRIKPFHVEAHAGLGAALAYQGKADEAVAEYETVLRIDSNHAGAHVNLGIVLARQNRLGDAVRHLRDAVKLDPGNAETHHALGAVLAQQGRFSEASAEFAETLRLNPEHIGARVLLAEVQRQQGLITR